MKIINRPKSIKLFSTSLNSSSRLLFDRSVDSNEITQEFIQSAQANVLSLFKDKSRQVLDLGSEEHHNIPYSITSNDKGNLQRAINLAKQLQQEWIFSINQGVESDDDSLSNNIQKRNEHPPSLHLIDPRSHSSLNAAGYEIKVPSKVTRTGDLIPDQVLPVKLQVFRPNLEISG